jgi:hypothetical protein
MPGLRHFAHGYGDIQLIGAPAFGVSALLLDPCRTGQARGLRVRDSRPSSAARRTAALRLVTASLA